MRLETTLKGHLPKLVCSGFALCSIGEQLGRHQMVHRHEKVYSNNS